MKDHYTYRVMWSDDDKEYLALCTEFPSLSWLAETQEKALKGLRDLVKDVVEDMAKNNEKTPEPFSTKKYSGKFQVRIPSDLHRKLAILAADEKISLNRLVSLKLSE